MEFEFNRSSNRLGNDLQKRREEARKKRAEEKKKKEEVLRKQKEMEVRHEERLIERRQQEELEEQKRLEEERVTGGIKYQKTLLAVPSTDEGDKLTLPASALAELNPQDALHNGPLTFELKTEFGTKTHAGVREFIAEDGTVGIPPKIARSLVREGSLDQLKQVKVKYVRLSRGTFARFQPLGEGFKDHHLDVKSLLEEVLRTHATLTEGDFVYVRLNGQDYGLRVKELRPDPQVLIIDTDVEVEMMVSEAAEKAQRALREAERLAEERRLLAEQQTREFEEDCERLTASLPPEPVEGAPKVKCRFRLSDGSTLQRAFAPTDSLHTLFDFVKSAGKVLDDFELVTSFPRRTVARPTQSSLTLTLAGLTGQQAFNVATKCSEDHISDEKDIDTEMKNEETEEKEQGSVHVDDGNPQSAWVQAQHSVASKIDSKKESTEVKADWVGGLTPVKDNKGQGGPEERWASQLAELAAMGFVDVAVNLQLLERYQGRLLRVVNFLSEM